MDRKYNDIRAEMSEIIRQFVEELFREEIEDILQTARLCKVECGKRFVTQQDHLGGVYVLLSGTVSVFEEYTTGNAYIFQENAAPDVFGEMESFAGLDYYVASLIAKTECLFLIIPVSVYMTYMETHPALFFLRSRQNFHSLLERGHDDRLNLQLQGVERVKLYLIRKYKKPETQQNYILSIPKQMIADETGFSLKTVQRSLKELREKEFVEIRGHKILISEEQYLQMLRSMEQITCD